MIIYYSVANLASEIGVKPSRAYNWYVRGLLPEPAARTVTGRPLWTKEQAAPAIEFWKDYVAGKVKRDGLRKTGPKSPETQRQMEIALAVLERKAL